MPLKTGWRSRRENGASERRNAERTTPPFQKIDESQNPVHLSRAPSRVNRKPYTSPGNDCKTTDILENRDMPSALGNGGQACFYPDSGRLWTVSGLLVVEIELSTSGLVNILNGFEQIIFCAFSDVRDSTLIKKVDQIIKGADIGCSPGGPPGGSKMFHGV